jgi:hypothetical protein
MSGILGRAIVAVVDKELILMSMAEEDASNNVWREAIHNLVEEICVRG